MCQTLHYLYSYFLNCIKSELVFLSYLVKSLNLWINSTYKSSWSISWSPELTLVSCRAALIGHHPSFVLQISRYQEGAFPATLTDWSNQNKVGGAYSLSAHYHPRCNQRVVEMKELSLCVFLTPLIYRSSELFFSHWRRNIPQIIAFIYYNPVILHLYRTS